MFAQNRTEAVAKITGPHRDALAFQKCLVVIIRNKTNLLRVRFARNGNAICFGDAARRRSRITDVVLKQGRTGPLCFVTVDHAFTVGGETRAEDRHIIVYRSEQSDAKPPPPAAPAPAGDTTHVVNPTPTLLFRYSALTFNGHRIHYDAPYATTVEGYPGLVVHGPLQATLLLHMAARLQGREPDIFSFRNQSTLYDSEDMILHSGPVTEGAMPLWTARASGPVAMQAEARWL